MSRITALLRRGLVPLLAVITALIFGAIVIILTDFKNLANIGSDPAGALGGALSGVLNGYGAMLTGALGDPQKIGTALQTMAPADIATAIRPFTETLVSATPLIFAGLGVAISFRAGMFNIGGDGQILVGALGATLTAFLLNGQVPGFVILVAALVVGTLFGAGYGFLPGFL